MEKLYFVRLVRLGFYYLAPRWYHAKIASIVKKACEQNKIMYGFPDFERQFKNTKLKLKVD